MTEARNSRKQFNYFVKPNAMKLVSMAEARNSRKQFNEKLRPKFRAGVSESDKANARDISSVSAHAHSVSDNR